MRKAHHIAVKEDEVASGQPGGRIFYLPGSPARARMIGERFSQHRVFTSERGHDVHTGTLPFGERRIDVAAVATGMGCPSTGIIVTELLMLGVRRFIRVGTAGTLQPEVKISDVVIASAAVRDEGASLSYAPAEIPAVASPQITRALGAAAEKLGLGVNTHVGVIHSKDSFYGREFGDGPLAKENNRYLEILCANNVLASEMEASHLFILAQAAVRERKYGYASASGPLDVQAGCILAILGTLEAPGTPEEMNLAVDRAVDISLQAAAFL